MNFLHSAVLLAALACSCSGACPSSRVALEALCRGSTQRSVLTAGNDWMSEGSRCCAYAVPPIKLLDTGSSIVDPQAMDIKARFASAKCIQGKQAAKGCVDPPAFYRQYTNVYTTDYKLGIPILSDTALNESFAVVRRHVQLLLKWSSRVLPNIREHLAKAYIRVVINSCGNYKGGRNDWSKHPEGAGAEPVELGGGSRGTPSVGAEESNIPANTQCYNTPKFPSELEEFFHTIHHVGMFELDPDAFVAITCLAARDVGLGRYGKSSIVGSPDDEDESQNPSGQPPDMHGGQGAAPSGMPQRALPSTPAERITSLTDQLDGDFLLTVGLEYYVSAIAVWMGTPLGDFSFNETNATTRAAIKAHAPDLACLIARYFPVVGEEDGTYCSVKANITRGTCRQFPGSCYCGNMTAKYLGPALNRSACPTLRQIKEQSGYKDKTLPGNAKSYQCKGCLGSGCDEDWGQARNTPPVTDFKSFGTTGGASGGAQICMLLLLLAVSVTVYHLNLT